MNDNVNSYANLALALSEETGIDTVSAGKVIAWLASEGVIDAPVVADQFNDEAIGLTTQTTEGTTTNV